MNSRSPEEQLFGAIALQLDFVDAGQLRTAMQSKRVTELDTLLIEQGAMQPRDCEIVQQAVKRHIERHESNTQNSLQSPAIKSTLSMLVDPALTLQQNGPLDEARTAPGAGQQTSASPTRYSKISAHAQGGLGQVFVARDTEIGREVALKEIKAGIAHSEELRSRFVLEAEVTGKLEHPGVVPIYGLGAYTDGRPFYAMRFIRGMSLRTAIEQLHEKDDIKQQATALDPGAGAISPSQTAGDKNSWKSATGRTVAGGFNQPALRRLLSRFVAVCNAIDYAHSKGVLHRDIKPDNIMLGEYGETLVVDWGLAKVLGETRDDAVFTTQAPDAGDSQTRAGAIVGTPAYMSPEQASRNNALVSRSSDIYSLGATLYAMLVGHSPLMGSTVDEVLDRVAKGSIPAVRELNRPAPAALEAICLKAMAKDPAARYASCRELAEDIEAYLAGEKVSAWKEPLSVRAGRWVRKNRTWATSAVVGISVLTLASLVGMVLLGNAYSAEKKARELAAQRADDLKTANGKEAAARALADKRLILGRQAVDQYLVSVTDDPGLTSAGFEPLRKRLLDGAGEFYAVFLHDDSDNPAMQFEQAWANLKMAEIDQSTGKLSEASQRFGAAAQAFEKLLKQQPDNNNIRQALGIALQGQAVVLEATGRIVEAEATLKRSTPLFKSLTAEPAFAAKAERSLADNINIAGNWSFYREQFKKAATAFAAEAVIRRRIVDNSKQPSAEDLVRLASVFSNTGHLAMEENRYADAMAQYEQGEAIYRDVVQRFPEHVEASSYRKRLAESLRENADSRQALGKFDDSLALYEKSASQLRQLVARHPAISEYQQDLAMVLNNAGALHVRLGDNQQGKKSYDAAIQGMNRVILQRPQSVRDRKILAGYLVNAASLYMTMQLPAEANAALQQAAALYRELSEAEPKTDAHRSRLAAVHVELAALHHSTGNPAAGIQEIDKANNLLKAIAPQSEEAPGAATTAGKGYHVLAMIYHQQSDFKQAAANYDRAIEIRRAALKTSSESDDAHVAFAASLASRSRVDVDAATVTASTIERLNEAIQLLAQVRSRQPDAVQPLQFSLTAYGILSSAERQLGHLPQAKAALEAALAIAPQERQLGVKLLQLALYGKTGDSEALLQLAGELAAVPTVNKNPWLLAEVARPFGHAVAVIQNNADLPETKRKQQSAALVARAVALLEQGEKAGGFVTLQNAVEALAGDGFNAIREREEFKAFMKKYESKPD